MDHFHVLHWLCVCVCVFVKLHECHTSYINWIYFSLDEMFHKGHNCCCGKKRKIQLVPRVTTEPPIKTLHNESQENENLKKMQREEKQPVVEVGRMLWSATMIA